MFPPPSMVWLLLLSPKLLSLLFLASVSSVTFPGRGRDCLQFSLQCTRCEIGGGREVSLNACMVSRQGDGTYMTRTELAYTAYQSKRQWVSARKETHTAPARTDLWKLGWRPQCIRSCSRAPETVRTVFESPLVKYRHFHHEGGRRARTHADERWNRQCAAHSAECHGQVRVWRLRGSIEDSAPNEPSWRFEGFDRNCEREVNYGQ